MYVEHQGCFFNSLNITSKHLSLRSHDIAYKSNCTSILGYFISTNSFQHAFRSPKF